jgi:predicted rRNA methylase YqxC with S4 and FtsJ domains
MNDKIKEREIIETKTTLETYKTFFVSRGTLKYLKNIEDFEISRLKLLARTNCLPINDVLHA